MEVIALVVVGIYQLFPRYANFTEHYVYTTTLNSATVYWNSDRAVDAVQYSLEMAVDG